MEVLGTTKISLCVGVLSSPIKAIASEIDAEMVLGLHFMKQ